MTEVKLPKVRIIGVEGLKTIIERMPFPKSLLVLMHYAENGGYPYNEIIHIRKAAENIFNDCFSEFLRDYDLTPRRIYIRENGIIDFIGEGASIVPESERRKEWLDGYEPNLSFVFSKENPIQAEAKLKRNGRQDIKILEDILRRMGLNGDGIEHPALCFTDKGIAVAGLQWIPSIIATIKDIYCRIGSRFEELADIWGSMHSTHIKGTVRDLLSREYENRIRYFVPSEIIRATPKKK